MGGCLETELLPLVLGTNEMSYQVGPWTVPRETQLQLWPPAFSQGTPIASRWPSRPQGPLPISGIQGPPLAGSPDPWDGRRFWGGPSGHLLMTPFAAVKGHVGFSCDDASEAPCRGPRASHGLSVGAPLRRGLESGGSRLPCPPPSQLPSAHSTCHLGVCGRVWASGRNPCFVSVGLGFVGMTVTPSPASKLLEPARDVSLLR